MKRRHLILLLGGTGSGTLSVGTGAFSSTQTERDVQVNVVEDDEALVGYHVPKAQSGSDDSVTNCDRITLVEIRNRFHENQAISLVGVQIEKGHEVLTDYEVERKLPESADEEFENVSHVAIEEGDTEPDQIDAPENGFAPGGYERITANVQGINPDETVEIEVTVTLKGVAGTGVSAQLFGDTRAFTITGAEQTGVSQGVNYVQFPGGSGKAKIRTGSGGVATNAQNSRGVVTASAYYEADDDCVTKTDCKGVAVDTQLELDDFESGSSGSIVGIEVVGIDGVFVHPNYDSSEESTSNSSGNSDSENSNGKIFVDDDRPTEDEAFDLCVDDESS